jgi:D-alanyl-D-alanine carboxypeptidase
MTGFCSKHRLSSRLIAITMTVAIAWAISCRTGFAQIGSDRYASIVIDAASGDILSSVNADEPRFPASLTKLMTVYMLFEALRDRRITLSQPVPVSSWAASMSPTKLGLLPGTYITVEQALLGLVTKSANDAAAALGELMGGDEERFAQMMTLRARALGMTRSTFRNASGLPDWSQVTTARDLAILSRHLVQDFPLYYWYFSVPSFMFQGRTILNHQRMLQTYPGADGLKTGYIDASGFNVVTSAMRSDTRLIGVVLGAASGWERDQHMASLLDQGFEQLGVPVLIARHDASPSSRLNQFISIAEAAPIASAAQTRYYTPRDYAAAWGGRRGSGTRAQQAAVPSNMGAVSSRRSPGLRNDRPRTHPIAAMAPRSSRTAPRATAPARDLTPTRSSRTGTRQVTRWTGRFPG